MTRVPSSGPPKAPPQPVRARKILSGRPVDKPVKLKTGADETEAPVQTGQPSEGAGATHDPLEHAKLAEAWQPESHAEKAEEKQAKDELHEEEKAAEGGAGSASSAKGFLKQIKPALRPPNTPVQQQPQKKGKDGFEGQHALGRTAAPSNPNPVRAGVPVKAAVPVKGAQPAIPAPRPSRPADAFSVLHAAQEAGVFFQEEDHNGPAEQSDPELTAAIEEAIRLLFGVRGILRVSGGFNQDHQPAIIVVATQGFAEASVKLVPPKVHRFETILAVPYDMLPLKRERL